MIKRRIVAAACAVLMVVSMTGCVVNKDKAVVTADGKTAVTIGYAQFCAKYMQSMYDEYYLDYYGTDMWSKDLYGSGGTLEGDVKDEVMTTLKNQYVIKQHAEELGISLSDDELKKIKKAAKQFMKDNDEDAIKAMGATEQYVADYLEARELEYKAQDVIEKQCDVTYTEDDAAQKKISYVLVSTTPKSEDGSEVAQYTEEQLKAFEVDSKTISTASDMDATAESLGYTVETNTYGADYKDKGTLNEDVYKAANKLKVGEISSPISVEGEGYYIVRLDSEYDEDATLSRMAEMNNEAAEEYYEKTLKNWISDGKVKVNKKVWKQVKVDKLFKVKTSDEETSK